MITSFLALISPTKRLHSAQHKSDLTQEMYSNRKKTSDRHVLPAMHLACSSKSAYQLTHILMGISHWHWLGGEGFLCYVQETTTTKLFLDVRIGEKSV